MLTQNKKSDFSPENVIEILQNIYQIEVVTPNTKEKLTKTLLINDEQREVSRLFNFGC